MTALALAALLVIVAQMILVINQLYQINDRLGGVIHRLEGIRNDLARIDLNTFAAKDAEARARAEDALR